METKPLTINLKVIDGNFVYALNEDQTNILDFSVRRGYKQQKNGFVRTKDDIKFSDEERNEFTADLVRRYNMHPQLLEALEPFNDWDFSYTAWHGLPEDTAVLFDHKSGRQITVADFKRVTEAIALARGSEVAK